MSVHASEISSIIKDKIAKSDVDVDVSEVGRVLSVIIIYSPYFIFIQRKLNSSKASS